jgi:hypothetical protein
MGSLGTVPKADFNIRPSANANEVAPDSIIASQMAAAEQTSATTDIGGRRVDCRRW